MSLVESMPIEQLTQPQEVAAPLAWSVGPWQRGEFAVLRTLLGSAADWPHVAALAEAIEALDGQVNPPEVLLLAQPRPGFYAAEEAAAVGRVAPLTRLVVVAGTWCEGEIRTGRPLPGTVRLYWYQFEAWWRQALTAVAAGKCPPWSDPLAEGLAARRATRPRPLSAQSRTVPLLVGPAETTPTVARPPIENCVAVDVGDFESFETLRIALRPYGWRCVWQPRHRPEVWNSHRATSGLTHATPVAGIWDGGQLSAAELEQLAGFATRLREDRAPVIALFDFPRAEHVGVATAVGAATVMGKPYLVESLASELADAVGSAFAVE